MKGVKNTHRIISTLTLLVALLFAGCSQSQLHSSCAQQIDVGAKPATIREAIILFDGSDFDHFTHEDGSAVRWKIVDGDAMQVVPDTGSIMTKREFQNFRLHVEFNVPQTEASGQGRGNSGVYLQRRYEVQILDSYNLPLKNNDCGALYKTRAADINVCRPPGQWQAYDIIFHAPRWQKEDQKYKKVENARITIFHNGTIIHNNADIPNKTGAGRPESPEPAPVLLQDHHNKVKFRNVWIVPLD